MYTRTEEQLANSLLNFSRRIDIVDIEDEIFRYRFSRKKTIDSNRKLKRLLKVYSHFKRNDKEWRSANYSKILYSGFITTKEQPCTVKVNYSYSKTGHDKFLGVYLEQKNKEHVKDKPTIFGNLSYEEYKDTVRKQNNNSKKISKHFKFVLSPELNLNDKQLKEFTELFVQRIEKVLGRKINWQAAVHQDTEHHHVHLLVNGKDQDGNDFRLPRNFIKETCRKISSEILTDIYGERSEEAISAARRRRVFAERFTEFDEVLLQQMDKLDHPKYCGRIKRTDNHELDTRLSWLYENAIADFENGYYYLKKNMKDDLTAWGRYKQYKQAQNCFRNDYDFKLYESDMGEISGIVKKIYTMNDEDVWANAVVIENPEDGKAWFVPLYNPPSSRLKNKKISVSMITNSKGKLVPDIVILKKDDESFEEDFEESENRHDRDNGWSY